jgi:hypothetical protein
MKQLINLLKESQLKTLWVSLVLGVLGYLQFSKDLNIIEWAPQTWLMIDTIAAAVFIIFKRLAPTLTFGGVHKWSFYIINALLVAVDLTALAGDGHFITAEQATKLTLSFNFIYEFVTSLIAQGFTPVKQADGSMKLVKK